MQKTTKETKMTFTLEAKPAFITYIPADPQHVKLLEKIIGFILRTLHINYKLKDLSKKTTTSHLFESIFYSFPEFHRVSKFTRYTHFSKKSTFPIISH